MIADDLEQCIRDTYADGNHHGGIAMSQWHRCGRLLIEARDTADHREGGFRGVCERTNISKSKAYRLIALAEGYESVPEVGHFTSVDDALAALKPPAPALPEVTPDSPELAARVAEMKRLQAECRRGPRRDRAVAARDP